MKIINNILKLTLILGILIVSYSVAYYYALFLPQQAKTRLIELQSNRKNLDICISEAKTGYSNALKNACSNFWVKPDNPGEPCSLPPKMIDTLKEYWSREENRCFKKYPIK